ncbi:MAG: hypothetical protein K2Q01_11260 [Rickettsiales bacterium]|nr:hypothetical protein [Rickettsiales bacterium]
MEEINAKSFIVKGMKFTFKEVDTEAMITYQPAPIADKKPRLSAKQAEQGNAIIRELAEAIRKDNIAHPHIHAIDDGQPFTFLTAECGDMSQRRQLIDAFHEIMERHEPQRRWLTVGEEYAKAPSVAVDIDSKDKASCKITITMPDVTKDLVYQPTHRNKEKSVGASEWFRDDYKEPGPVVDIKTTHIAQFSPTKRDGTYSVLAGIASALRKEKKKVTTWPTADKPTEISFNVPYEKLPETLKALEKTVASTKSTPGAEVG